MALITIATLAMVGDPSAWNGLWNLALIALMAAVGIAVWEAVGTSKTDLVTRTRADRASASWTWAFLVVVIVSGVAARSWFHEGTVIGTGDVTPPVGTAWITRIFWTWTWSGSDVGGPSTLVYQLPWAAVLMFAKMLGGSAGTAQQLWYTLLYVGAACASLTLLYTLELRPFPAVVGSLAYFLSPYAVANVVPNPVYLATLAMLPVVPAIIFACARGLLPVRWAVALMAATSPMLGYLYQNPPLLATVLAMMAFAPIVAGTIWGWPAGRQGALCTAVALPLTLAVSMYWIVPSILVLPNVATGLANVATWSWTEGRATVGNAIWLNTFWGWRFPEYVPFAAAYETWPLTLLRFAPAMLAFGALGVWPRSKRIHPTGLDLQRFRLAVITAGISCVLIFLSTGTNPPGNLLFDFLYSLPFGWLIREPGRFLIVVALMYAVLIALTIEWLIGALHQPRIARIKSRAWTGVVSLGGCVLVIVPGLPLLTGVVVPDARPVLPPAHVAVPEYWIDMAAVVDNLQVPGALLVMPPDDFYQMPYTWGYYGDDVFITELITRPVLVPSAQSYLQSAPQLMRAVSMTATSILDGDWVTTGRLVRALNTPLILVRGDVDTSLSGRTFRHPDSLSDQMLRFPNFSLVHVSGPLQLFELRGADALQSETTTAYATVDSQMPDLRVLKALPIDTVLISSPPLPGVPSVVQLPPISEWPRQRDRVTWDARLPSDWKFDLVQLDNQSGSTKPEGTASGPDARYASVSRTTDGHIRISIPVQDDMPNGDFHTTGWDQVSNCANFSPQGPPAGLSAAVFDQDGPSGGQFIRLTATRDSACVSQSVTWHGGPLLFQAGLRHLSGVQPRLCLWETGPEHCATLLNEPAAGDTWTMYRSIVTPDPGTKAITLFLYSDVFSPGTTTANDFGDIQVLEPPALPQYDLVGEPSSFSPVRALLVHDQGYSMLWHGPTGTKHVLVDGLFNGWLGATSTDTAVHYVGDDPIHLSRSTSLIGTVITLCVALSAVKWRRPILSLLRSSGEDRHRTRLR
jgi:arabinofuranan 3-O-arabinosyltransferase